MLEQPLVSIIIVSLNGEKYLGDSVESALVSDYPNLELIVVDNGSGPAMKEAMKNLSPQVRQLTLPQNVGFAAGNNRGIEIANGDIIILLNDDTIVEPDWINVLVARMLSDERIQVVGCKILDMDKKTLQHAGGFVNQHGLCSHRGHGETDSGQYNDAIDVDYVTGAAIAIRKTALETTRLLEESYFPLYYEEVEYCYTVRQMGGRVVYDSAAVVYHHGMRTSVAFSQKFFFRFHRNRMRFLLRNYYRKQWPKLLRQELKWLLSFRNSAQYGAVFLAYLSTFRHLLTIMEGRRYHLRHIIKNRNFWNSQ
jgi:GT2 family glycosyltransferase